MGYAHTSHQQAIIKSRGNKVVYVVDSMFTSFLVVVEWRRRYSLFQAGKNIWELSKGCRIDWRGQCKCSGCNLTISLCDRWQRTDVSQSVGHLKKHFIYLSSAMKAKRKLPRPFPVSVSSALWSAIGNVHMYSPPLFVTPSLVKFKLTHRTRTLSISRSRVEKLLNVATSGYKKNTPTIHDCITHHWLLRHASVLQ